MAASAGRGAIGIMAASLGLWGGTPGVEAARPWPDSSARIVVFADQLNSGMSAEQLAFAAARLAGAQKMIRSDLRAIRQSNPDFLCLHYQLALGCGAHNFIVGDEWTSDWAEVNAREDWFLHNASGARVHQTAWDWDVMDITSAGAAPNTGFPEYWIWAWRWTGGWWLMPIPVNGITWMAAGNGRLSAAIWPSAGRCIRAAYSTCHPRRC